MSNRDRHCTVIPTSMASPIPILFLLSHLEPFLGNMNLPFAVICSNGQWTQQGHFESALWHLLGRSDRNWETCLSSFTFALQRNPIDGSPVDGSVRLLDQRSIFDGQMYKKAEKVSSSEFSLDFGTIYISALLNSLELLAAGYGVYFLCRAAIERISCQDLGQRTKSLRIGAKHCHHDVFLSSTWLL